MKRLACLCVALGACATSGEDYPVITQGGGGGGGGSPATLIGRVCLVDGARNLSTCSAAGAAGLTVSIGGNLATTTANGEFVMNTPAANASTISVTGTGIVPSTQALTTNAQIPVINQELFDQMVAATGITTTAGTGSIMATVVRGHAPLAGRAAPAP